MPQKGVASAKARRKGAQPDAFVDVVSCSPLRPVAWQTERHWRCVFRGGSDCWGFQTQAANGSLVATIHNNWALTSGTVVNLYRLRSLPEVLDDGMNEEEHSYFWWGTRRLHMIDIKLHITRAAKTTLYSERQQYTVNGNSTEWAAAAASATGTGALRWGCWQSPTDRASWTWGYRVLSHFELMTYFGKQKMLDPDWVSWIDAWSHWLFMWAGSKSGSDRLGLWLGDAASFVDILALREDARIRCALKQIPFVRKRFESKYRRGLPVTLFYDIKQNKTNELYFILITVHRKTWMSNMDDNTKVGKHDNIKNLKT